MSDLPIPSTHAFPPGVSALADLLFSGVKERPMWSGFLMALSHRLHAGPSGFILERGEGPARETAVLAADPACAEQLTALPAFGGLRTMPFDTPRALTDVPGGAPVTWHVLRIHLDSSHSAWLAVAGTERIAPDWEAVFSSLLALLQRIVPLFLVIGDGERRLRVMEHVLETSGVGIVVVDPAGHILMANAVAHGIVAENDVIAMRDGALRAGRPNDNRRLQDSIRDMAEQQSANADASCYTSVALERDDQAHPLTLIVRPGPSYAPVTAPLRRTAVVILRDPARRGALSAPDLEQFFALSRAEARLAGLLADGLSLEDAAATLGVSRNTARSQLQAIFAKTGTNRQGDLVRLLLSSAASLTYNPVSAA
ncbi:MAG: helix-turn-helix transcriptional regulator [Novosphingobium sp.]|nr:helix-turn-helix transcriptional regulator [Novosphingobium sp.]